MKYILMMTGKKSDFDGYAKWSKEDLRFNTWNACFDRPRCGRVVRELANSNGFLYTRQ
jgi:hypothetical protein